MIHREHLDAYILCLRRIRTELAALDADVSSARRLYSVIDEGADSIDFTNHLIRIAKDRSFADLLKACIWDVVRDRLPVETTDDEAAKDPRLRHALEHASRLFQLGVSAPSDYLALLSDLCAEAGEEGLPRLEPAGLGSLEAEAEALRLEGAPVTAAYLQEARERIKSQDLFAASRTFRRVGNELHAGELGAIRSLDNFYGYREEREFFEAHFKPFVRGEKVLPLLLMGMPGVGKTHLTIAYALSLPEVTLVNADRECLEGSFEGLLRMLGRHHYRRFVLFFDDIDPETLDWSTFRNQIDGYWPQVKNVALVIATNGEFSPQVRSRGKVFEFRPMNPEVCQEFVAEYLEEHRWMSQPYPNLVSTVATDYASMFKRRVLNELTPRSLIRYFETLEGDQEKIRKLVRESLEELVRVPSQQSFDESNQQIIERMQQNRKELAGHAPPVAVSIGPAKMEETWLPKAPGG